jgi:hypothetical protein
MVDILAAGHAGEAVETKGTRRMAPAEAARVLPPQATMTLTGLPRHSFTTKVKDTCEPCRGKGAHTPSPKVCNNAHSNLGPIPDP